MKTLKDFCESNNLTLVSINYRFKNVLSKGWDIVNPSNNQILASFEPVFYSNGDRWYLRDVHEDYKGARYFKRLDKSALLNINPAAKSFMLLSK